MELRHSSYFSALLIIVLTCHTSGEISNSEVKSGDQPFNVQLGQELVAPRSNGSQTTSSLFMEGGSENSASNKTTLIPAPPAPLIPKNPEPTTLNSSQIVLPLESEMSVWPGTEHDKNSGIKARKGVSPNSEETNSTTTAAFCTCCVNITSEEQLKNCTCCPIDLKITTANPPSTVNAKPIEKTQVLNQTAAAAATTVTTAVTPPPAAQPAPVPHHLKPNVTADAPDLQVPAQQEDYVIPVVGIIFAIPLIIILGALVYKKGADLWERRHYRRMDFLIDGIYNQ